MIYLDNVQCGFIIMVLQTSFCLPRLKNKCCVTWNSTGIDTFDVQMVDSIHYNAKSDTKLHCSHILAPKSPIITSIVNTLSENESRYNNRD